MCFCFLCLWCFFLCECFPFWEPKGQRGWFWEETEISLFVDIFRTSLFMLLGSFWDPLLGSTLSQNQSHWEFGVVFIYFSASVYVLDLDCILMASHRHFDSIWALVFDSFCTEPIKPIHFLISDVLPVRDVEQKLKHALGR